MLLILYYGYKTTHTISSLQPFFVVIENYDSISWISSGIWIFILLVTSLLIFKQATVIVIDFNTLLSLWNVKERGGKHLANKSYWGLKNK